MLQSVGHRGGGVSSVSQCTGDRCDDRPLHQLIWSDSDHYTFLCISMSLLITVSPDQSITWIWFVPGAENHLNRFHGIKTRTHPVPEGELMSNQRFSLLIIYFRWFPWSVRSVLHQTSQRRITVDQFHVVCACVCFFRCVRFRRLRVMSGMVSSPPKVFLERWWSDLCLIYGWKTFSVKEKITASSDETLMSH